MENTTEGGGLVDMTEVRVEGGMATSEAAGPLPPVSRDNEMSLELRGATEGWRKVVKKCIRLHIHILFGLEAVGGFTAAGRSCARENEL